MLSILTASGSLLWSFMVVAWMLQYQEFKKDIRGVIHNAGDIYGCAGCSKEVLMVDREALMILAAIFTIRCRVLQSETIQFPYQMVRVLVRLFFVPLLKVMRMGGGSLANPLLSYYVENIPAQTILSHINLIWMQEVYHRREV